MSSLRSIDLSLVDEIFRGGEKGYVLDFSNRTFTDFFARELSIDIDAPQYAADGISKGKRLRCFLGQVDNGTAARTLRILWEYREALRTPDMPDPMPRAAGQVAALIARLEGTATPVPHNVVAAPLLDAIDFARLRDRLIAVRDMEPHERGFAFERFLTEIFDACHLNAREPFRLQGEQIDGSFEHAGETYLVEAKWLNRRIGAAELHVFEGKIGQKAAWARGLFISFGGVTDEGLHAFGRGKRTIAMEGRDLYEALDRGIGIDQLIAAKTRRAAETGAVFAPLAELFK
ncbi:restriction endonuclease [Sphingomonas sp. 179-I 2A4 NHS]|uniref:restriction endonuclease n=1 Tax=unclassified Sphingomonas TaxID=196159 RepID=UPI00387942D6